MNGYACRLEIAAQDLHYAISRMWADADAAAYSAALAHAGEAKEIIDGHLT